MWGAGGGTRGRCGGWITDVATAARPDNERPPLRHASCRPLLRKHPPSQDDLYIKLDANRNQLLMLEVLVLLASMALGMMNFVCASFGMNMNNGVPDVSRGMWGEGPRRVVTAAAPPPTARDPCAPRVPAQTLTAFDEVTAISAGLGVLLMVGVGIAVYRYMR